MANDDTATSTEQRDRALAQCNSRAFRDRLLWAIKRQAQAWGIRPDQAQSLLLDWRSVA